MKTIGEIVGEISNLPDLIAALEAREKERDEELFNLATKDQITFPAVLVTKYSDDKGHYRIDKIVEGAYVSVPKKDVITFLEWVSRQKTGVITADLKRVVERWTIGMRRC
jgi:hypothetical protein